MLTLNLSRVKERDSDLYYKLMDTYLIRESDQLEVLSIPDAKVNWLTRHYRERALKLEQDFKAEADAEQQQKADAEAAEKRQKIASDTEAFKARMVHYIQQGLQPTAENEVIIIKWLRDTAKGYLTAGNADAAISVLRKQLAWKPKEAPAPPPPSTPPPPPVRYLDNGERELPLDASTNEMRAASLTQLRNLSKRRNEGRQTWRIGWTGANL